MSCFLLSWAMSAILFLRLITATFGIFRFSPADCAVFLVIICFADEQLLSGAVLGIKVI
jgi:hypothetical protein